MSPSSSPNTSAATAAAPVDNAFYHNKVVVVTGGGSGIGKALCEAFSQAGAIVVALDLPGKTSGHNSLPWWSLDCNVTSPSQVAETIRRIKARHGKIDVYCSNAGIMVPSNTSTDSCVKHSLEEWNRILQVNVVSHILALQNLVDDWENGVGEGHFCVTASAAGLLTMVGDASYGVSKAAALSFCEHVAISHGHAIQVHCLCPQGVDTPLVPKSDKSNNAAMTDGILSPQEVATVTLQGIAQGDFFIFPHSQVPHYALRKAQDHNRWIKGMQRMRNKLMRVPQGATKGNGNSAPPRSKL